MSKLFLEAIRALPEDWIDDKTQVVGSDDVVVVVHPDRKPIMYIASGRWEEIKVYHLEPAEPEKYITEIFIDRFDER